MSLQVNVCVEVLDTNAFGQPAIVRVMRGETVLPPDPTDNMAMADLLSMTLDRIVSEVREAGAQQMVNVRTLLAQQAAVEGG